MIWAFGRLIFITVFSIVAIALAVIVLRQLGLQKNYSSFTHPLSTTQPLLIADGGDLDFGPEQSWPALSSAANIQPTKNFFGSIIIGIHLRLTSDGEWVLYRPEKLQELTTGEGYVSKHTRDELKNLRFKDNSTELIFLDELFQKIKNVNFFINIIHPANASLTKIFDLVEKNGLSDHVILRSEFSDTTKEIRDRNARWLSTMSTAEIQKSYFLTALYLETAMDLNGDVFIANRIDQRLFQELFRRKKIIVYEMVDFAKYTELQAMKIPIGIVTKRPTRLLQTVAP